MKTVALLIVATGFEIPWSVLALLLILVVALWGFAKNSIRIVYTKRPDGTVRWTLIIKKRDD